MARKEMGRELLRFAVLLLLPWFSAICSAQLVVVRPGYVKAPFVRVHSYPDGSSYVRAPFVAVHSPARWPKAYYPQVELIPTSEDMGDLDWMPLRRALRQSAADLDAQLSRFPTGEVWRSHLSTGRIPSLVLPAKEGPPAVEEQAALAKILQRFDESSESSELRAITSLYTFHILHAALREYMMPVELRTRRLLTTSNHDLHRALSGLNTGARWKKYLTLPIGAVNQGDTNPNTPGVPSERNVAELKKLRGRYDLVSAKQEYHGVTRLTLFQTTHRRLQAYLDLLAEEPPRRTIQSVEELPTPKLDKRFGQE